VDIEVIDIRSLNPLDFGTILESVRKTKRLLVTDDDARHCGIAAEVVASVVEAGVHLAAPPVRITHPDCPSPSSAALAGEFYPTARDLFSAAANLVGRGAELADQFPKRPRPVDVPDFNFPGPF
jgi:pyruvate dehydrogenase E1 component beta subunit